MKSFKYILVSALLFCAAVNARAEQLSEQTYDIRDVRELYAASGLALEITQGDTESLRVSASPNIMKRVHVDVTNHKLSLSVDNGLSHGFNWFGKSQVTFFIVIKDLAQLELSGGVEAKIGKLKLEKLIVKSSGGSEANFENLQIKDIFIDTSGGASVNLGVINSEKVKVQLSGGSEFNVNESGATNFLTIEAGGGSEYKAKKLLSQAAEVRAGGAAEVDLSVEKTLSVNAGGASSVNYHGKPSVISDIGGASELTANN